MIRFVIMDTVAITNAHINASLSNNTSEMRQNNTGLKTLLSFCSSNTLAEGIFIDEKWYSKEEILIELEADEWQPEV